MAHISNLTLEERFTQLEEAKQIPQRTSGPKIQRVAHHLRDRKHFTKHYLPRLVSFGPIHYGNTKLQLGEQLKLNWAATYINSYDGQTSQTLLWRIEDNIANLKDLFDTSLFTNNDTEEKICWMLFVDGCALLQIVDRAKLHQPENMNIKIDQLALVMQDVLLLENQLPYPLLKLLWRDTEAKLMEIMKDYLRCHHWATRDEDKFNTTATLPPPSHLLDFQRTIILRDKKEKKKCLDWVIQICDLRRTGKQNDKEKENHKENKDESPNSRGMFSTFPFNKISFCLNKRKKEVEMVTYRNIQELKAAGVKLKSSHTRRPRDISFARGWPCSQLTLPEIVVDDTTETTVLNLIAYEMCPDFVNDYGICSFVAFLESLIDHPDDVKALRSKGILLNSLGSDEEVAKLFNIIGADMVPDMGKYSGVRAEIESHYKNKCRTWLVLGYHTYFSNPWAIIAFSAAALGLALTFIQTWFAIHPTK